MNRSLLGDRLLANMILHCLHRGNCNHDYSAVYFSHSRTGLVPPLGSCGHHLVVGGRRGYNGGTFCEKKTWILKNSTFKFCTKPKSKFEGQTFDLSTFLISPRVSL